MQWYQINAGKVAHETIDHETIIINFDTGAYYSIDQLGMEIWEQLQSGAALTGLTEIFTRNYSGDRSEMADALHNFITELIGEGLVVVTEGGTDAVNPVVPSQPAASLKPFQMPVLNKYTDMQDLLLLDAINDVDEQGWPIPNTN
jgi:hypothetical protein